MNPILWRRTNTTVLLKTQEGLLIRKSLLIKGKSLSPTNEMEKVFGERKIDFPEVKLELKYIPERKQPFFNECSQFTLDLKFWH